jgi:hypothetical protein
MKFWKEDNGKFKVIHNLKFDNTIYSFLKVSDNLIAMRNKESVVEIWRYE